MYLILGLIYIIFIMLTMLLYYIIGYIVKTDILNAITLRKSGVSFIGVILLFVTSMMITYIVEFIKKDRENK